MGIRIGKKKLNTGRVSLFLDINCNGKRRKEYLGIILDRPDSKENREANRKRMEAAGLIRLNKELSMIYEKYPFVFQSAPVMPGQRKEKGEYPSFNRLFQHFTQEYKKKDVKMVIACMKHFETFVDGKEIRIQELDKSLCADFRDYLYEHCNGATPANYFKKFKGCVSALVEKGILERDPTRFIRLNYSNYREKESLTFEEITQLIQTPCKSKELKRAFLFSCNCGLRWCDVKKLDYSNIDFEHRLMQITQSKVAGHSKSEKLRTYLNNNAYNLLTEKGVRKEGKIFNLPSYSYSIRILGEWAKKAGLEKKVTFHCARHSFITNLVDKGVSIKTVAALAGHSTTKHTERYIHAIDEHVKDAVELLDMPDPKNL